MRNILISCLIISSLSLTYTTQLCADKIDDFWEKFPNKGKTEVGKEAVDWGNFVEKYYELSGQTGNFPFEYHRTEEDRIKEKCPIVKTCEEKIETPTSDEYRKTSEYRKKYVYQMFRQFFWIFAEQREKLLTKDRWHWLNKILGNQTDRLNEVAAKVARDIHDSFVGFAIGNELKNLGEKPNGTYFIRLSKSEPAFTLDIRDPRPGITEGKIVSLRISAKDGGGYSYINTTRGIQKEYSSLKDAIEDLNKSLFPNHMLTPWSDNALKWAYETYPAPEGF
jgi:hypothetical protein